METKKTSNADLEKGKTLALLIGALVSLAVLFVSFEWGTKELKMSMAKTNDGYWPDEVFEGPIPGYIPPPPPPPPPPPIQEVVAEILTIVANNEETGNLTLMSSEDSQKTAQTEKNVQPAVVPFELIAEVPSEDEIFEIVEIMPQFPGGNDKIPAYLAQNINYPVIALENGIYGRVVCAFVVNQDGSIVDVEIVRSADPSLDREALRVISAMPKWKPGNQGGKDVRVKFNVPVTFRLQH
jgi:protein TonB